MSYRAAVALGSNLGDRLATLREAVQRMDGIGSVTAVSSLYETAPVGGPDQGPYLNAVIVLDTDLVPEALLDRLQKIEARAGRVRSERWGPRTLDLDIVAMADAASTPIPVDTERLRIPHPRAAERRFVLEPLAEVWPEASVGTSQARNALKAVGAQEVERLPGDWTKTQSWISPALVAAQLLALVGFAVVALATGSVPEQMWRAVAGVVVVLAGAALGGWAAVSLGSALTPFPEPKAGTELVDTGPYRWVRHPIYAGIVVALFGATIFVGSWAALAVAFAIAALLWFKAGYEESRLRLSIPGYSSYLRRVRGRMVPLARPD